MGIYTDLSIFGIRIYNVSYDDDIYNLFQRKYDLIMTDEKIKEAYLFYEELYDIVDQEELTMNNPNHEDKIKYLI